jgi:Fur family peroxide stress response transcriptional regulator
LDWVSKAKHHPTAEEVYLGVKEKIPSIGFATVYRNLAALAQQGKIQEVQFVDHKKRYACGRIIDMELSALLNVRQAVKNMQCHEVQSFRLELIGVCAACRKE